ncbi:MAG: monofunctional biosynthetic peptidoglycan transglycosylase [Paracoccaceae bacterium]
MAKRAKSSRPRRAKPPVQRVRPLRVARRWALRAAAALFLLVVAVMLLLRFVNPPITHTIWAEQRRLGAVERQWVPIEEIAPVALRAVVAAEDANFCTHWGFDMGAIRDAIEAGARRGGSTISQQTVKNVFLWQGRSWPRKALEALLTPLMEALWPKRRILEVYVNVAEFDEGVFGIGAAARRYFGVTADRLSPAQAARLAAVLPNPKGRDAANLPAGLRQRAAGIMDGAATIEADGRSSCFES